MELFSPASRELFLNLARREVRGRYKGSWLGVAWTMIIPLVLAATYTFVFSFLLSGSSTPHYPLYIMVGIAFWGFFSAGIIAGGGSLLANKNLVTKVQFPRAIIPASSLSSHFITMLVMLLIMVPASIYWTHNHGVMLLLIPLSILPVVLLVLGLALAMSVVNVYFRDVEFIVSALLIPWFFCTPILYDLGALAPLQTHHTLEFVLRWVNFPTPFIALLQDVIYRGRVPSLALWLYTFLLGAAVLAAGFAVFQRLQRDLAVEL